MAHPPRGTLGRNACDPSSSEICRRSSCLSLEMTGEEETTRAARGDRTGPDTIRRRRPTPRERDGPSRRRPYDRRGAPRRRHVDGEESVRPEPGTRLVGSFRVARRDEDSQREGGGGPRHTGYIQRRRGRGPSPKEVVGKGPQGVGLWVGLRGALTFGTNSR